MTRKLSKSERAAEREDLRARLAEAEEVLRAIRSGDVDAVVVAGEHGEQVYTLSGADRIYRQLIEAMSEGAVTLSADGVIQYANQTFARLLQTPLELVIGAEFLSFVSPADQPALAEMIEAASGGSTHGEVSVRAADGSSMPMRLGLSRLQLDPETLLCMVATDLTEENNNAAALRALHAGLEKRVEERTADLAASRLAALNMMEDAIKAREVAEVTSRDLQQEMAERKLQEQKVARLNRILAVLSGINSLIVRVGDRQELFNEACHIAVEHGQFGIAWIGRLNQETLEITPAACAGVDANSFLARGQNIAQPDTALSQNMANRAIGEKRAVFSNDLATEPGEGGERRKEAIRRGYRSAIALPLLMDGTAMGNLSLFTKEVNFFTVDEVKLLSELAGDISFALHGIARQEKLNKLSRIRAVSSGINAAIVHIHERELLLKETCRIAVKHGKFELAWIATLDLEQQEARPVAWSGFSPEAARSVSLATIKTIGGSVDEAIRTRRPVINNNIDAGTQNGLLRREAIGKGCSSAVCIPLVVEGKVSALCVLYALGRDFFDPDEIAIVNELAGDISHALQAIARQEKLNKLSRMRTVSGEINAAIVRIREREPLLKDVCRIAVEHGKFELVWIALVDQKMQKIQPMAWAGFSPEIVHALNWDGANASQTMLAEVMLTRKIAVRNDIEAEGPVGMLREAALKRGCHSAVCLPLLLDDAVVTVIILYATGTHFFDQDELALLSEVAANLSFALQSMARQEKLNYLAYYDALTGLPNRALFDDRMTQVLRAASHENSKTALVLIDLERFRIYNDTLGRGATDDLLKQVAQRLQGVIFDRDSLARIHADVFAGLFPDIKGEADIAHLVEEKIFGCLSQPFTIARQELRVSAKIGVALFPGDALVPDALFSAAEAALKQAKDSSDRYLFYARKMNAQVAERLQLESKLQRALEREQFVLFYQPKVDLGTGHIAGLEALLRWNDPETGLVMPMLFIPLLEETGMIAEVGAWAMQQAVTQYAAWQAAGLQPPPIAVNVSQVQLKRRDFVASVQYAIAIAGKPDHGLDLEITESMIMEDIEACIGKLKAVRDLGVGIFIDDFGTGHSSLRYLTRLPITALKIDRAFIQHMATNADDVAIVSTVIALGHNLNLRVIAEGVETEEQSKFLRLLRCDEYQGYLFSKPVPADQVPALLVKP